MATRPTRTKTKRRKAAAAGRDPGLEHRSPLARVAATGKTGGGRAARESGKIQSLRRASAILDAVARHPGGIGLSQISADVGLHSSTAFHLIQTLASLGFLAQLPDSRRYRIGPRLFALAAGALDETALLTLATPILERLSAETGYACHLAIRSKQDIVVIARTAATGLLQLSDRSGATRPAHATAIGKTLLAALPADELDRVLETLPLPAFTPNTRTDRQSLRREIESIRRTGVAHDDRELDRDVRCLAVPVLDFAGRCAAAMGVSGPAWRLTPETVQRLTRQLTTAATELSGQLGGKPQTLP